MAFVIQESLNHFFLFFTCIVVRRQTIPFRFTTVHTAQRQFLLVMRAYQAYEVQVFAEWAEEMMFAIIIDESKVFVLLLLDSHNRQLHRFEFDKNFVYFMRLSTQIEKDLSTIPSSIVCKFAV